MKLSCSKFPATIEYDTMPCSDSNSPYSFFRAALQGRKGGAMRVSVFISNLATAWDGQEEEKAVHDVSAMTQPPP